MSDDTPNTAVLARALTRLGWRTVGGFREALSYWEPSARTRERSERVVLPLIADAPDYLDLLGDAIRQMQNLYGRDFAEALELATLLLERKFDEVNVKRETDNDAGLIKWQSGNQLVDSTQGILAAAAKSSNLSRKRYSNAQAVIADDFLSQCYMGQTRVGSYIVTALTPSNQTFATSKATGKGAKKHPRISGREITATLVTALEAVREALDESAKKTANFAAFDQRVIRGVSFELLAALQPVTTGNESAIAVEFNHNEESSLLTDRPRRVEVAFTPEDGVRISQARAYFEKTPAPKLVAMVGEITALKNSESDAEHQIRLHGRIKGKPRTVVVHLSEQQYDEAVRAHGSKRMFSVLGELEERTRGSVIAQAENVRVEQTPVSATLPDHPSTPLF